MVTNKAITIGKDINIARCKGNWSAIPELARRYKKHNPNGVALEQSVLAENSLNQIISTHRKESTLEYANDSPNAMTLSARVDPNLMKPIQHQLSTALGDKDASAETTLLKQMSKILLARTYFESGEYKKAIEVLNEIDLQLFEQHTGYSYTLYSQALVIRAVSLELLNMTEDALKAYGDIVSLVNANANLVDRMMVDWVEEGLYRGVLFALSDRCNTIDVPRMMGLIRAYQKTCSSQLNTWRIYKRLVVTKYSLKYLSTIYRNGHYVPPVEYSLTEEGKQISEEEFHDANRAYNHQLFSIEIMQLHTVYEKLVYSITQFPKSGQTNSLVLEFVNCLASDFEVVGGTEAEKRGFVEALNRASEKTFNSPCVTRHLFHALVNLGDYEQAEHALRTYLYLVGLESKALVDSRSITPALASDSFGFNTPVPSANEVENLAVAEKHSDVGPPQKTQEIESTENKIHVLVVAVKMYCEDLCKGADAVAVAEMAEQVYTQATNLSLNGAEVYRTLGVAFGFLASQTFDQDRRPQYHEKALESLRISLKMNGDSWETYYQMAFQLAEMRDINGAIPMISQSLQLNSSYLPSWHLLSLLCTCPIKDNLKQALKTCEIAINEASPILKDSWIDYSDEIAQQILLHKTQTLLVERVHGTDAALISQEALFQIFGKIVVPELIPDSTSSNMLHEAISNGNARYGMILSGSLGNIEPSMTENTRHRSSSNASTFTNGKTKSISSFTGRKFHLAEMFHHQSDASSVKSVPILKSSSMSRKKEGSLTSLHSTTSMLSTQNTLLQTTATLTRPTTQARLQHQRSSRLLCELWLLSAEAFLKMNKLDEALKAVSEAENVDWTTHAGVWCVLGRIRLAQNQKEKAILAFQKGLVTKPNDVECRVWLAKTYIELGELEVAEGILEAVTQENGWDHPSAWFYLGEIYKQTDRLNRTKDCLFYALELESTKPIQPFTILPRFV